MTLLVIHQTLKGTFSFLDPSLHFLPSDLPFLNHIEAFQDFSSYPILIHKFNVEVTLSLLRTQLFTLVDLLFQLDI